MGGLPSWAAARRLRRAAMSLGGALALLAGAPLDAGAQFQRIVPPPPCVVPLEAGARPAPRAAGDRRPLLLVERLDATTTELRAFHLPWALTDRLRERLRRTPGLSLVTDGSAERALYDAGGEADSAATLLGADWIVRGKSASFPGGVTITLALTRRGADSSAWSASYRLPEQPLSVVEGAIARGILGTILGKTAYIAVRASGAPRNADADDLLALGDFIARDPSAAAADSARAVLERAFAADTSSPLIAVRLAEAYLRLVARGDGGTIAGMTTAAALRRAEELAAFAIARDARRADAWTARALAARARDTIAFSGALAAHARAIALAPRDAAALHARGETYVALGDDARAAADFRRALTAEPERGETLASLAALALRARRFQEACAFGNAAVAAAPFNAEAYAARAQARLRLGQARDAYADAETAARLANEPWTQALQLLIQLGAGNGEQANALGRALTQRYLAPGATLGVHDAAMLARAFLGLGDDRRGLEALSRARPRGRLLVTALRDPAFDALRGDSAFTALSTVTTRRGGRE